METYSEAIKKILKYSSPLKPRWVPLKEALGLVAARDVRSGEDLPGFDNSAVDGFAVALNGSRSYSLVGEIPAGKVSNRRLYPGEAMRVFTGAALPQGTQTVLMQEHARWEKGRVLVENGSLIKGSHIRRKGEDIQKGKIVFKKGTSLASRHIALCAALGIQKVSAYPRPLVSILATGSELSNTDEKPKPGKIRDSNTILLEGLVREAGAIPRVIPKVGDHAQRIHVAVHKGLRSDLLIVSGGVSVGKYDFVREAFDRNRVRKIFWKVDIKPGKPVFFGKKGRVLVFGLPGNPVSIFVTFREFVLPAIRILQGKKGASRRWIEGRLAAPWDNGRRIHFVRVRYRNAGSGTRVIPQKEQGSHCLGTLARANGMWRLEPFQRFQKGDRVFIERMDPDEE